jgi:hypothetical protein
MNTVYQIAATIGFTWRQLAILAGVGILGGLMLALLVRVPVS